MACIVVFCTTYALILPAITMERDAQCGLSEHTHDAACYTKVTTVQTLQSICTHETLAVHAHTDPCRADDGSYVCGYGDFIVHEHSAACYDPAGKLICQLAEIKAHTHSDDCYETPEAEPAHTHTDSCYTQQRGGLICEEVESEGHSHTDACYTQGDLTCQTAETAGHTHDETCTVTELVCTLQSVPHEHGGSCYAQQLSCDLPEDETHSHSSGCYTDVLTCTVTEDPHEHTDSCYQSANTCGLEETPAHTHSADCYDRTLNCTLEETRGHQHADPCYEQTTVLTCELEENAQSVQTPEPVLVCEKEVIELHTHSDSCWDVDGVWICGQPEIRRHSHEDSCVETVDQPAPDADALTCGAEESEDHTHSDQCYGTWELTCAETEHTHEDACYPAVTYYCGLDEHTHGEACYDAEGNLTCELTEHTHGEDCLTEPQYYCGMEAHLHEDGCYDAEGDLTCELEEHIHFEDCLIDPETLGISTWALLPDTVIDSGTIANAEGVADAITWKLTQDEHGVYTLTISGTGAIPDFANANQTPWYPYAGSAYNVNLVIADGITRVGKYSFQGFYLSSLEFAPSVAQLGSYSFSYLHKITSITIPGTVKVIEDYTFVYSYNITEYILCEGIESIGTRGIHTQSTQAGSVVTIPASVTSLEGSFCNYATAYEVAEGNETYIEIDGVLYTKDGHTLVDYPKKDRSEKFRIPEDVTTVLQSAFTGVNVSRIIVPSTVTKLGISPFRDLNSTKEIIIEDNTITNIDTLWFHYSYDLTLVRFPENTSVKVTGFSSSTTYNYMKSLKIPNKTTYVLVEGKFPALETVYYDAENATIEDKNFTYSCSPFQLTVGANVNNLPATFDHIVERAGSFVFKGENYITAVEGAFASAPSPLTGLSGAIYVDAQGVVYSYDATSKTATVVYVSPGAKEITIPEYVTADDGTTQCKVTAVKQDAFRHSDTTALTIAKPENFTSIETNAFANCPTLTRVNGEITVEEAEALFTNENLVKGYGPFYNTGLGGSYNPDSFGTSMNGDKEVTITNDGATDMKIYVLSEKGTSEWTGEEGNGGYVLLTGDSAQINISAGNTEGTTQNTYRVYLRKTGEDCSLNVTPGQSYTFTNEGVTFTVDCLATEDPNTVCLEFTPGVGETVSFSVTAEYPSPSSPGGGLTVWGEIVTGSTGSTSVTEPTNQSIQLYWTTKPDEFGITKAYSGGTTSMQIFMDETGVARPKSTMTWTIDLTRQANSSAYGKDYAEYIEFTDVHKLPTGVVWDEDVVEAIKNNNFTSDGKILKISGETIFTIEGNNLSGLTARWDETQQTIVISWRLDNPSEETELNAQQIKLKIAPKAFNATAVPASTKVKIDNTVNADVYYHYSEKKPLSSPSEAYINAETGYFALEKTASGGTYFGEDVLYTVDIYNTRSYPYTSTAGCDLTDTMSQSTYIKPENMEKMFQGIDGDKLTITISNAVLGTWQQITNVNGGEGWAHPGNSDIGSKKDLHTIAITYSENLYHVSVDEGTATSGESLSELLQSIGYGVTYECQYTCLWNLAAKGDTFTLKAGEHKVYEIPATYKDSFQLINTDWRNYHASETVTVENKAVSHKSDSVSTKIKREAYVDKSVSRDGVTLGSAPTAGDRQILDYHLNFRHYGDGSYEDIPMVDDLYGSQYLLVPVASNSELSDKNLKTVTDDDVAYYILTVGEYDDVCVGVDESGNTLIADTITVVKADGEQAVELGGKALNYTGIHTQIKWYFPEMYGNWQTTVDYKAIVDMSASDSVYYTIGNIVWMNDRTGSRLYDPLWGGGTIIDFEKDIVVTRGATPEEDVLADEKYSLVSPGEEVTYRLTLHNTNNSQFKLPGDKLADALPSTHSVFTWEKGTNVTEFDYELSEDTITHSGLENWTISNEYTGMAGDNQQYIVWPDEASITFPDEGTVYLYFTLTYPANTESDAAWDKYAAAVNGNEIHNTVYVYYFPDTVTHNLDETGEVLLQKGVSGMYHYDSTKTANPQPAGSSRFYYNNRDSKDRMVEYYVMLYNGGNKRLYLDTLVDTLPRGFTFQSLVANNATTVNGSVKNKTINVSAGTGTNNLVEAGSDTNFLAATITAATTDTGVNFTISPYGTQNTLSYDSEKQKYYLNRGEAVAFGFICEIGATADTNDEATNTISMAYDDYLGTGLTPIDKTDFPVTAKDGDAAVFGDKNDGTREVKNGALYSEVTVERGGIIPGVTKFTESLTDTAGKSTPYEGHANYTDTVVWKVMLHNSGTLSITDYTFQDIMPYPYSFEGDVRLTVYDAHGNVMAATDVILTFPDRKDVQDNPDLRESELTVTGDDGETTYEVAFNAAAPVQISTRQITLSLSRNDDDDEIMTLRVEEPALSIPEGGYVEVLLSSRNPAVHKTQVYVNQATLTPNKQPFTSVGHGSMIRENDIPTSVINSSPVAVTTGVFTTSEKHVTEKNVSGNTAVSTNPLNNRIVLASNESLFTYKLVVQNSTSVMKKLVLIDNLPQVGDYSPFDTGVPRYSEFQVNFAANPNFTVTVIEDGVSTTLEASTDYTIQYSTTTDFGGPQSDDWRGKDTGKWKDNLTGARAFRLIVTKVIPASARVEVTFDAVVDTTIDSKLEDSAEPGEIAWNSFGYHYTLQTSENTVVELEAMPLVVGVSIPSVPELEKRLVDDQSREVVATADETFTFLLYEGEALSDSYETAEALTEALEDAGLAYKEVSLTVEAGKTTSGSVPLKFDDWTWTDGAKYTITEIACGENYTFNRFHGANDASYTFTYDSSTTQTITCENLLEKWSVTITKVDKQDAKKLLPGAVFGLYSPEEGDKIKEITEAYQSLGIQTQLTVNNDTWYLAAVAESDEDGIAEFKDLLRPEYYLAELKAPDGYNLPQNGWLLDRSNAEAGVYTTKIENTPGYELPETGGAGMTSYTMGGLLLTAAALLLLYIQSKRGKEDFASS